MVVVLTHYVLWFIMQQQMTDLSIIDTYTYFDVGTILIG